ncbi:hypothetical protein RRG08_033462 [Elysia crispata]|uniref:Uncharacterized protein n=1 Tax=Elysia crispata TaxID=231223 RepID=A0AAE1AUA3_9GAST|nr:hypothetical protein RRG08_033462 [Elysia crispata]
MWGKTSREIPGAQSSLPSWAAAIALQQNLEVISGQNTFYGLVTRVLPREAIIVSKKGSNSMRWWNSRDLELEACGN